jgi:hypothetical protein
MDRRMMHVGMHVCMYITQYVYMYVRVCMYMLMWVDVCMCVYITYIAPALAGPMALKRDHLQPLSVSGTTTTHTSTIYS